MSKISETKICQNCKSEFTIEPDDFGFYEKIKVPPPTFCPGCRLQRRLAWMVDTSLYKRTCDLCDEDGICKYDKSAPVVVYCHKCWWSDGWDPLEFGENIDFNISQLGQFKKLLHTTPLLGLSIDSMTGQLSPYVNHCDNAKNCYMIFYSSINEDSLFGFYLANNKSVLNSSMIFNSELCFDAKNNFKNYRAICCMDTNESMDCSFLKDCNNCSHCFGSINLRNKRYVFFNKELTKEEYFKELSKIDLGSFKNYTEIKEKAEKHFLNYPRRGVYQNMTQNCSGSYVFQSKNCRECYEVCYSEDCKYCMLMKLPTVKDCYDYTDWGYNAELIYDSIVVGENVSNIKFSWYVYQNSSDVEYSALCVGCKNCFLCVGLKNKEYCILNKQYTKKEYFNLKNKIIENMNKLPFIDQKGRVYKYGEFFPLEFSTYPYNNTFADFFFPKYKNQVLSEGLVWQDKNPKNHQITISYKDMPDHIKDTEDKIINEIISCSRCERGYRITKQELDFSRRLNVPLSRECPFCRIGQKINIWVSQMKQIERTCDKCYSLFPTHYTKEEAPQVLCDSCYKQEVY